MTERIQILLGCQVQGCQVQGCAEEVSYHPDQLRLHKGRPICEECYPEVVDLIYDEEGDGAPEVEWNDLPMISLEDLSL